LTAIVGFAEKGRVWIGGDSAVTAGWDVQPTTQPKVFRVGTGFLVGTCGYLRTGQLIRYAFTPPALEENEDADRYLATTFTAALRTCLKDAGTAEKHGEREAFGGGFLLGFRGRLFHFGTDYSYTESPHGFAACGCGEAYALGALHAGKGKPADRVRVALEAAARFSAGVRAPFTIECL
jgi:20S proteasome alpha/beta subunit